MNSIKNQSGEKIIEKYPHNNTKYFQMIIILATKL